MSINLKNTKKELLDAFKEIEKELKKNGINVSYEKVNLRNTKQKIYDNYIILKEANELPVVEEELEEIQEIQEIIEEVVEEVEIIPVFKEEVSRRVRVHNPSEPKIKRGEDSMSEVKNKIMEELEKLKELYSKKLEKTNLTKTEKLEKYEMLIGKINEKEKILKEIFALENEELSLEVFIELKEKLVANFKEEKTTKLKSSQEKIDNIKEEIQNLEDEYQKEINEKTQEVKKENKRNIEEYEYNFKRKKQLLKEEFINKKEELEKELAKMIEEEKVEMNLKTEELDKKLNDINDREKTLQDLDFKTKKQEQEKEITKEEIVSDLKGRNEKTYRIKESYINKDYKSQLSILENKKTNHLNTINDLKARNQELAGKLEEAYIKIQNMALKSAENSANANLVAKMEKIIESQSNFKSNNQK